MYKKLTFLFGFLILLIGQTATVVCQQDLSDGLVGYWPLDEGEGATTVDRSEIKSDGTLIGDPTWGEGIFESALEFDGVDDYVDCGINDLHEFGPGDFTISAWFKSYGPSPEGVAQSDDQTIFAKGGDDTDGIRYHLYIPNNTIEILLDGDDDAGGKGKYNPDGNINVVDSTWHHVVAYRNELTLRVYLDGAEEMGVTNHAESTLPTDYVISPTVHAALIGAITRNLPAESFPINKFFHGSIDDVALWERMLEPDEIAYLWNGGAGNPVLPKVSSNSDMVLGDFILHQNYPNPFNTVTTFSFQLSENNHTKLTVYDVLGQEVEVLLDGMRSAGTYKEQFDGSELAEGVYFARLQAGMYSRTIKVLLTR